MFGVWDTIYREIMKAPRVIIDKPSVRREGSGSADAAGDVQRLQNLVVHALRRHPEARKAVVEALRAQDTERGLGAGGHQGDVGSKAA